MWGDHIKRERERERERERQQRNDDAETISATVACST